ncbi:MAG: PP2C family serine/threonine-protein phosphatase [Acidimicrobiales bacterium]
MTATACPVCGEPAPTDSNFCEACGADLDAVPVAPCVACGESDIFDDGYCMSCGHKQPTERDHLTVDAGPVVAVTDRGRRHRDNEDAAAVGLLDDGSVVLVVCDGVSSTPGSAEASSSASIAARDVMVSAFADDDDADVAAVLVAAAAAAQAEATAAPAGASNDPRLQGGPPSSTFVAAVARPDGDAVELSVAWLGDSRAYWLGADTLLLTDDHELGGSLTRWIGADAPDVRPDLAHARVEGPGRLLLCSDGLWRYADEPGELAALVERLSIDHPTTVGLASALVEHANASGGHDNITVALWPSPSPSARPAAGGDGEGEGEAAATEATDDHDRRHRRDNETMNEGKRPDR